MTAIFPIHHFQIVVLSDVNLINESQHVVISQKEEYKEEIEYNYARYLLCSSLRRMSKIQDKNTRKKLLDRNWELLNEKFPS